MDSQTAPLEQRLFEAGNPRNLWEWQGLDGHYVATCRVSKDDVPALIDIAKRWSDPWQGEDSELDADREDVQLLPVTAWRTLADLRAGESVQPLVDMLCELEDEFDDWTMEELPHVFGKIGPPAVEPLTRLAGNRDRRERDRSIAVLGLQRVAEHHAETRDGIVAFLTELMTKADEDDVQFNTTVLVALVELQAAEAAEAIERAFANNRVDVGMYGPWEDVRQRLGVEGLGLEMPKHPRNSVQEIRRNLGLGSSSQQYIVDQDDIDHDPEDYDQSLELFLPASDPSPRLTREARVGRNDPCPCGSGKKYKKCCGSRAG